MAAESSEDVRHMLQGEFYYLVPESLAEIYSAFICKAVLKNNELGDLPEISNKMLKVQPGLFLLLALKCERREKLRETPLNNQESGLGDWVFLVKQKKKKGKLRNCFWNVAHEVSESAVLTFC